MEERNQLPTLDNIAYLSVFCKCQVNGMENAPNNSVSRIPREYRYLGSAEAIGIVPKSVSRVQCGACAGGTR